MVEALSVYVLSGEQYCLINGDVKLCPIQFQYRSNTFEVISRDVERYPI